jgi:ribonuclease T2
MLLLLSLGAGAREQGKLPVGEPGAFDYYALSMSWSPNFCATHRDPHQCATGRQFGFVLHGLWPQYHQGYPQSCSSQRITPALERKYAPLFASPKLILHEWPKHGTCSGLAPEQYFDLTAKLKQGLVIPADYRRPSAPVRVSSAEFAQAFKASNPGLAEGGVLPFCSGGGRFLQERALVPQVSVPRRRTAAEPLHHHCSRMAVSNIQVRRISITSYWRARAGGNAG